MLVFIASLRRELRHLKALVRDPQTTLVDQAIVTRGTIEGQQIALVQVGMGKGCAQKGAHTALRLCRPAAVFAIGYAGGLTPDAMPGDLVMATSVSLAGNPASPSVSGPHPTLRLSPDEALVGGCRTALDGLAMRVHRGPILTVPQIANAASKGSAARDTDALALDMESYWIADVMVRSRVPFAVVRAISDRLRDEVPDFSKTLDPKGESKPLATALYFVTHPQQAGSAIRLRNSSERASRSLGRFASAYVHRAAGRMKADDHAAPIHG